MKKLFLITAFIARSLYTIDDNYGVYEHILFAQPDTHLAASAKGFHEAITEREEYLIAKCIQLIKELGDERGKYFARLLLKIEMRSNPHNTVFFVKYRLNQLGFDV